MVWYSYLFKNFPQFFLIHTVKGFGVVNEALTSYFNSRNENFWNSLAFTMIQQMLVRPCVTHRQQPTRLPCRWDSPGKTTGVGCHMLNFKPTFSLSSFTFIKRFFSSSSLSAIRVVSFAYLRLLIFLPVILIPACASSSPAFLMMDSAYKLNEQDDNIQP